MKSVNEIIAAMPPEDKKRLEKLAAAEKKTVEEMALFILSKGANTPSIVIAFASAASGIFF